MIRIAGLMLIAAVVAVSVSGCVCYTAPPYYAQRGGPYSCSPYYYAPGISNDGSQACNPSHGNYPD